jgi:uncharacterized protein YbaR (Trm112 family)
VAIKKKQILNLGDPLNQNRLFCPISKTALMPASDAQLKSFNNLVRNGQVHDRNGDRIEGEYSDLLLNENFDTAYRIRLDIPQLIPALSISLEGLNLVNSVD